MPNNLTNILSGVTGEYYVAAELSKLGHIASITLRNTKGVDVLCSNSDATKTVAIQVKTNKGTQRKWIVPRKILPSDSFFYAFVNLNNNTRSPDYFIVPSRVVMKMSRKLQERWLGGRRRDGTARKDTMPKFIDLEEKYKNGWDLLGL